MDEDEEFVKQKIDELEDALHGLYMIKDVNLDSFAFLVTFILSEKMYTHFDEEMVGKLFVRAIALGRRKSKEKGEL